MRLTKPTRRCTSRSGRHTGTVLRLQGSCWVPKWTGNGEVSSVSLALERGGMLECRLHESTKKRNRQAGRGVWDSTAGSGIAQCHPEASSSAAHPVPAPSGRGSSHLPAAALGSASPAMRQHAVLSQARRDQALELPRLLLQTRWTDPQARTGQQPPTKATACG